MYNNWFARKFIIILLTFGILLAILLCNNSSVNFFQILNSKEKKGFCWFFSELSEDLFKIKIIFIFTFGHINLNNNHFLEVLLNISFVNSLSCTTTKNFFKNIFQKIFSFNFLNETLEVSSCEKILFFMAFHWFCQLSLPKKILTLFL